MLRSVCIKAPFALCLLAIVLACPWRVVSPSISRWQLTHASTSTSSEGGCMVHGRSLDWTLTHFSPNKSWHEIRRTKNASLTFLCAGRIKSVEIIGMSRQHFRFHFYLFYFLVISGCCLCPPFFTAIILILMTCATNVAKYFWKSPLSAGQALKNAL